MTKKWPVQEAKSRFSELLETAKAEGPQIVTKRGVETAVLVPIEEWRRLDKGAKPSYPKMEEQQGPDETAKPKYANIKEWLLAPEPRIENLAPPRRHYRFRIPDLSD